MSDMDKLKSNLEFVQGVVTRGRTDYGAAPIYYLWAIIIAIGFALPDFAPHWAFDFWVAAGIGGGLLSTWLGLRSETIRGVRNATVGWRYGLHWLVSGGAIGIAMLAMATGKVPISSGAALLLLIVGLAYSLAGIHLNPPLRWAGFIMMASAVALLWLSMAYLWTTIGLAVAAALVVGGIVAQRSERE
jgi:hypothetical protein